MLNALLELAGFALIVAFFAVVWWPLALLVAGVALVITSYVRDRTPVEPSR